MAGPLRIELAHALLHVTSRGNARQRIVRDDRDRERWVEVLRQVVERFGWTFSGRHAPTWPALFNTCASGFRQQALLR